MKTCTTCNQTKLLSEFYKDKFMPSGYAYKCKVCSAARNKAYHENNKEAIAARKKANYDPAKQ